MQPSALEIQVISVIKKTINIPTINQRNDRTVFHLLILDTCTMVFPSNSRMIHREKKQEQIHTLIDVNTIVSMVIFRAKLNEKICSNLRSRGTHPKSHNFTFPPGKINIF